MLYTPKVPPKSAQSYVDYDWVWKMKIDCCLLEVHF
jgi:hypothetical protein